MRDDQMMFFGPLIFGGLYIGVAIMIYWLA
jgi:hypothetical protein